jgi:hypothetical protein
MEITVDLSDRLIETRLFRHFGIGGDPTGAQSLGSGKRIGPGLSVTLGSNGFSTSPTIRSPESTEQRPQWD